MQSNTFRNTQEFSDFDNSQMYNNNIKNSNRLNNSMLTGDRADSPMLNNEVQKTNQFIEETNDYLSK